MQKSKLLNVKQNLRMIWPLLSLLAVGCATTSPPPVIDCPHPPSKPVVLTSASFPTYSANAQTDISRWRAKLINASQISNK